MTKQLPVRGLAAVALAVAVAAQGGTARAQFLPFPESSSPHREAGSHGGALMWEDRYDPGDNAGWASVATLGDKVYTAGRTFSPASGWAFSLRALEARTGALEWEDQSDRGRNGQSFVRVATDHHRVFVAGVSYGSFRSRPVEGILRAYRADSGELLWEDSFEGDPYGLAVGGGRVFLAGLSLRAPLYRANWAVRAHDASTGELLWQDEGSDDGSRAFALAFEGHSLYAGGFVGGAHLRAYDARTGALSWQRTIPGSDFGVVKVHAGRVFALHAVSSGDPGRLPLPHVVAYGADTGQPLWDDVVDVGPMNTVSDIDASGPWVTAVGSGGPRCTRDSLSDCDALVRTWRASTGARLWERQLDLSGLNDIATLITAGQGSVFIHSAAGSIPGRAPASAPEGLIRPQWVVHAFDGRTGELGWQTVGADGESGAGMALDGGRLFVTGTAPGVPFGSDGLVRAYDARGRTGSLELPLRRQVALIGTSGEASYDVTFDGPVSTAVHGLVPADEAAGIVVDDPIGDIWEAYFSGVGVTLHPISVPDGTRHLRVSLFDQMTDGVHDLDLYVFGPDGELVAGGESINPNSNEVVDLTAPAPGEYTVVVHGYQTAGPEAHYTLFTWTLGDAAAGNLFASGPVPETGGPVDLRWSGLTAAGRYLGAVSYRDGSGEVGHTLVTIHAAE